MFQVLLIIFFLLFAFLVSRRLLYGLLLIAAFLSSYMIRFQVLGLPGTVLEGMIIIVILIWLIKNRFNLQSSIFNLHWISSWFWPIILFFAAATLSAIISPHPHAAWGIWKAYFLEPILLFFVFIFTVKSREDINKIIWALVLGALFVAIFAVIQKFTGWLIPNPYWQAEATRRVTGFFGYPNAVALYLSPLIPLQCYLLFKEIKSQKFVASAVAGSKIKIFKILLIFFSILVSFLSIIFAKSTGALVALAAIVAIFGLWHKKTRWFIAGLVIAAAILIPLTPLREPLQREVLFGDRSGVVRLNMWGETVEMLRQRPILGAGLVGFQTAVQPWHVLKWAEIYLYPHNLFLNFWSETGLIGLIAFLWLMILVFRANIYTISRAKVFSRERSAAGSDSVSLAPYLLASFLIILIHGLVDVPYFKNDLAVMFWLLTGLIIVNKQ